MFSVTHRILSSTEIKPESDGNALVAYAEDQLFLRDFSIDGKKESQPVSILLENIIITGCFSFRSFTFSRKVDLIALQLLHVFAAGSIARWVC